MPTNKTKMPIMTANLTWELKEKLSEHCRKKGITISEFIRHLLTEFFDESYESELPT